MVLVLALAALGLVGLISAVVAWVRGWERPVRTVWGYDTRRPMLP